VSKPRSRAADFAAYVVVRLAVCLIQALTDATACRVGRYLGWLAYRLDARHRRVVYDNLRHAFPTLTAAERERLGVRSFGHFVTLLIDYVRIQRKVNWTNWRTHGDVTAAAPLFAALRSGRPVMIVTGHLGNWEVSLYGLGLIGYRIHAIARPLDNPFVDNYLRRLRESMGQRLLSKSGDLERIMAVLEAGGTLATLVDQDAGPRGQFVEFFGRPASTHKPIALLALKYHALIVVTATFKVGDPMKYEACVEDVIDTADYAGETDSCKAITQRYTAALERLVRRAPEQYFWMHRRWKSLPAARTRRAA
jgi:KDO2-lipid IV(A) lauroyltransferase